MKSRYLPTVINIDDNPKYIVSKKFNVYLGKVMQTNKENKKLKKKQVGFNIEGLPEFTSVYPVANPMFDMTREMKKGDLIIVRDYHQDPNLHTFFYMPYREDDFVGIENEGNVIDATKADNIIIKTKSGTIIELDAKGNITLTAKGVINLNTDVNISEAIGIKGPLSTEGNVALDFSKGGQLTVNGIIAPTTVIVDASGTEHTVVNGFVMS
jgi:hypothetical protein